MDLQHSKPLLLVPQKPGHILATAKAQKEIEGERQHSPPKKKTSLATRSLETGAWMMTGFQKQAKIPTSLSPLLHPTDLANHSSTTAEQPVPMSTVPN